MALKEIGDTEYQARGQDGRYVPGPDGRYVHKLTRRLQDHAVFVCEASSREQAAAIAKALNEAEGL
jgi:hypothetical protein